MHVRFQTSVVIGGVDKIEWSATNPATSALAGAIAARAGRDDRGESRDSIVFECRIGKDAYDVEVPKSNIAHVIRSVEPQQAAQPAPAGAKEKAR